jgi:tRNA A37 threonylcarbamoyladenosine dehydratase
MKKEWRVRTEFLIGSDNIQKLEDAHVFIAGLGGVGGYAAEQLCRAGIGELTLLDSDVVESSNRNRQIIALISTEGMKKTEVVAERLMRINSELKLHLVSKFLNEGNVSDILVNDYDFIVDAIDTLTPKVTLLAEGVKAGIKIVSSMGSGGRMDPGRIEVCDIADSHHCRFASMVRKYLHRLNINTGIQVVFSPEKVSENSIQVTDGRGNKRSVVGTISYMPAMFGCHCAAEVIREIVGRKT